MIEHDADELVERLRRIALVADPMPESVAEAARAAFSWRTIDAELAELTYDSLLDRHALVGVRGGVARQVTFESDQLTIEIEVGEVDGGSVVGQLVPPQAGRVEVRHRQGVTTAEADALGRFVAAPVPRGPVSLRCATADGPPTQTDWLVL